MTVTESHRTAIRTKFLGPTDYRGSRVRVWRADSSYSDDPHAMTISWEHALNPGENHTEAVRRYVAAADWNWPGGHWVVGGTDVGHVAVWSGEE